ncbi:MAG: PLP-dependent aminotransferase family protein [Pseudomonadota bacterium]
MNAAHVQLNWDLKSDDGQLSQQICDQIRGFISTGVLRAGDRMPATRQLAHELSVARGTVATAIELLVAEGILETRTGAGTFVAAEAVYMKSNYHDHESPDTPFQTRPPTPDIDPALEAKVDLRPCRPSLELFPMNVWRRCMSAAASTIPDSDYGDPQGSLRLREAIASYLRRARGLSVSAENIVITNGSVQAMHILASLYLGKNTSVAFEDPGFPLARQVFSMTGANMHLCPVDKDGLVTDTLSSAPKNTRLVYVTPSHQFLTGGRLSLRRRRELVDWANKKNVLIIEDDYDGEYRYDVPPLEPLAAVAQKLLYIVAHFPRPCFPAFVSGSLLRLCLLLTQWRDIERSLNMHRTNSYNGLYVNL